MLVTSVKTLYSYVFKLYTLKCPTCYLSLTAQYVRSFYISDWLYSLWDLNNDERWDNVRFPYQSFALGIV